MATSSRTVRSAVRRALHVLFPSWRRTLVALAVEVVTVLLHLPPPGHLLVAVATHVLVASWLRPRLG